MLRRPRGWRGDRDNDVDLQIRQFGSQFGEPLGPAVSPSHLEADIPPLDVAKPGKLLPNCVGDFARHRIIEPGGDQDADPRDLGRLLRACRERPSARTANHRDKITSSHGSPRSVSGTLRYRGAGSLMAAIRVVATRREN
jgi:hypothetical protein